MKLTKEIKITYFTVLYYRVQLQNELYSLMLHFNLIITDFLATDWDFSVDNSSNFGYL